ncbi:MAG: ABC transporter ATP-binding protein [Pirellulaceae bacterium]|jgi:ABC-2 type transport system ATP-binding protein|nr:ABC transporter ATP-binding protein [Pirellulaceae bacterium]
MDLMLEVERLEKSFGPHKVLRELSFAAPRGALMGFLGPNGAGKTTTIRILLGLLRASGGACRLFGEDVWRRGFALRRRVGYLPGEVHFYDRLTGLGTLQFLASARHADCLGEGRRLAECFGLELHRRVRDYSTGMRQKLGLIQAMMHRPELLILDEPSTGLDPLVRQTLYDELRGARTAGRTILFSSHSLNEVESLCDEVVIVRDGEVVEDSSIEKLRERAVRRVRVRFTSEPAEAPDSFRVVSRGDGTWEGTWTSDVNAMLVWLRDFAVADLQIEPPDLEDLFLAYYETESGDD